MRSTPPPARDSDRPEIPSPSSSSFWSIDDTDASLPNWKDHIKEIPFLSNPRPRALTPAGFRDEGDEQDKKPVPLFQKSAWFKIPPNIRRDILRIAFGDRRLHMSLSFTQQYNLDEDTFKYPDPASSDSWQWFGSVCHRQVSKYSGPMTAGGNILGPWADKCINDETRHENTGVIGWLLSCRQNYAETIDLLYAANTIVMSGEAMITHIARLLLPQRLAAITSLEIRWPLEKIIPTEPEQRFQSPEYDTRWPDERIRYDSYYMNEYQFSLILDTLSPTQFPNLRRLYISFEKKLPFLDIANPQGHDLIVRKFCQFVETRPELNECAFALPEKVFDVMTQHLRAGHPDFPRERKSYSQVWCDSKGNLDIIRLPFENSYPEPPFHLEDRQAVGFWLLEGSSNVVKQRPIGHYFQINGWV